MENRLLLLQGYNNFLQTWASNPGFEASGVCFVWLLKCSLASFTSSHEKEGLDDSDWFQIKARNPGALVLDMSTPQNRGRTC